MNADERRWDELNEKIVGCLSDGLGVFRQHPKFVMRRGRIFGEHFTDLPVEDFIRRSSLRSGFSDFIRVHLRSSAVEPLRLVDGSADQRRSDELTEQIIRCPANP